MTGELTPELRDLIDAEIDASGGGGGGGSETLAQTLALGNDANALQIANLADPTDQHDAATKAYVDAAIGGASAQAIYRGTGVSVPNTATGNLPLTTLASGNDLLDRTDPANPVFLEAGTYAITATAESSSPLTSGGYAVLAISVGSSGSEVSFVHANATDDGWTATFVGKAEAGGLLQISVDNFDGVATRTFDLFRATIVKFPSGGGGGSQPVLFGSGQPSDTDGTDGQLYIDTDTHDVYVKSEGSWT